MPHPGCFTPEKQTRYPLYRRLGGPQGPFWTGFDPQTVQQVVSRYTDYAILDHRISKYVTILNLNLIQYLFELAIIVQKFFVLWTLDFLSH